MITKKEKMFYADKMIQLCIKRVTVYLLFKNQRGLKTEVSKALGIVHSSLSCIITGKTNNPKVLVDVYEYLNKKHTNRYFKYLKNLTSTQKKSVDSLLMNGFSYWEAIRIAND